MNFHHCVHVLRQCRQHGWGWTYNVIRPYRPTKNRCTAYAKNFSKKYCVKRSKNRKCVAYRRMYKVSKCLKYKVVSAPIYHRTHRVFVVKRYRAVIANQKKAYLAAKARWTKSCTVRVGKSLSYAKMCRKMRRVKLAKRRSFRKWRREFRYRLRAYRNRRNGNRFYKYRAEFRVCKKKMIQMSKNAHVRAQMNAANKARKARLHRKYKNIMSIQDVTVRHQRLVAYNHYRRHSRRHFQKKWSKKIAKKCGCLEAYLRYNRSRIAYRRHHRIHGGRRHRRHHRIHRRRVIRVKTAVRPTVTLRVNKPVVHKRVCVKVNAPIRANVTVHKRCNIVAVAPAPRANITVSASCRGGKGRRLKRKCHRIRRIRRVRRDRRYRGSRVTRAQINACFIIRKSGVHNKVLRKVCVKRVSKWSKTAKAYRCISRSHKYRLVRCAKYAARNGRVVCVKHATIYGTRICLKRATKKSKKVKGGKKRRGGKRIHRRRGGKRIHRRRGGKRGKCIKSKVVYPKARCVKTYKHNGVKFCSAFKFYRPTAYCRKYKNYGAKRNKRRISRRRSLKRASRRHRRHRKHGAKRVLNKRRCLKRGVYYGRRYNKVSCGRKSRRGRKGRKVIRRVRKGRKSLRRVRKCKVVRRKKYANKKLRFRCQKCRKYRLEQRRRRHLRFRVVIKCGKGKSRFHHVRCNRHVHRVSVKVHAKRGRRLAANPRMTDFHNWDRAQLLALENMKKSHIHHIEWRRKIHFEAVRHYMILFQAKRVSQQHVDNVRTSHNNDIIWHETYYKNIYTWHHKFYIDERTVRLQWANKQITDHQFTLETQRLWFVRFDFWAELRKTDYNRHESWMITHHKHTLSVWRGYLTRKAWTQAVFDAHIYNHNGHYNIDMSSRKIWNEAVVVFHNEIRQYHFDIWNKRAGRTWATWGAFAKQITEVYHEANRVFHDSRFNEHQRLRKFWYNYQVTVYRSHYAAKTWGQAEFEGRLKCLTHDYKLMRKSYIRWHNYHHVHHETHWRSGRKSDLLHGQANVTPAQHHAAVVRVNAMYLEEYRIHLHDLRVLSTNCVKKLEVVLAAAKKNPTPAPVVVVKPAPTRPAPPQNVIRPYRPTVIVREVVRHHHHTRVVNHHHHHHSHRVEVRYVHHHHHHHHGHHHHAHWRHHTHVSTLWRGINFTTVYDKVNSSVEHYAVTIRNHFSQFTQADKNLINKCLSLF